MLGFEIGQRESGFYSERTDTQTHRYTDTQTHRVTQPSSTVLVYRFGDNKIHNSYLIEYRCYMNRIDTLQLKRTGLKILTEE